MHIMEMECVQIWQCDKKGIPDPIPIWNVPVCVMYLQNANSAESVNIIHALTYQYLETNEIGGMLDEADLFTKDRTRGVRPHVIHVRHFRSRAVPPLSGWHGVAVHEDVVGFDELPHAEEAEILLEVELHVGTEPDVVDDIRYAAVVLDSIDGR